MQQYAAYMFNIPVWTIIFLLINSIMKRKNYIEKRIGQTLDDSKKDRAAISERLAIVETKLEIYERRQSNRESKDLPR